MNTWSIPDWLEENVGERDKFCVYCGIELKEYQHIKGNPQDKATWEHIDNEEPSSEVNIVRCCNAYNASKGRKELTDCLNLHIVRKIKSIKKQ
jgi:hypothetical protein